MATPRDKINTRAGKRNQITLTDELLKEMGIQTGDTFKVSRIKRAKRVEKGAIVLTPASDQPRSETEEEWRSAEAEAEEDIRLGRVSGPYTNAKDLIADLRRDAKKWQKKSG